MAELTWDWLEGHPALDLVNTVKRIGWQEQELLRTPADLDSWLRVAALPAPRPAVVDESDLQAVIGLRDPALRLIHAAVDRGEWLASDVAAVNARLLNHPDLFVLGDQRGATVRQTLGRPSVIELLLTRLASEVRDAIQRADLAFCDAPGCGLMFYRRRNNQAWCGAPCGNRARVERHHRA